MNYVYFVHGELHHRMALTSIASVRKVDEKAIIHLYTDEPGRIVPESDVMEYIPPGMPMMLANLEAQARAIYTIPKGQPVAFLDTDILLTRDVTLRPAADLTVTWRDHALVDDSGNKVEAVAGAMPYNYGVIFATGGFAATEAFLWMRERVRRMSSQLQSWYGNQIALGLLAGARPASGTRLDMRAIPWTPTARGNHLWVCKLPCEEWNYTPQAENEDLKDRAILHFKGKKRPLMEQYARSLELPWTLPAAEAA